MFVRTGFSTVPALLAIVTVSRGGEALAQQAAHSLSESHRDRAGELYVQGRDAFIAGNAADAYLLLQASNALDPSPNTDLLLGHALVQLDRIVDAILSYESAIERAKSAPRYAETAAEAVRRRADLIVRVGRIELASPAGMKVALTRPKMARAEFDKPVTVYSEGGLVTAQWMAGDKPVERSVTVEAGSLVKLFIEELRGSDVVIERSVSPWVPTGVVIASVGGVGLGVAGALGAVALGIHADLEVCTSEPCGDQSAADLRAEGMSYQTATNVCLVAGGTLLAAGIVMTVVALVTEEDDPRLTTAGTLEIIF